MTAYYNEIDPYAAQWLRNLIAAGHIAPGDVDERSIVDVRADDLRGYTQCHFFAGIGGWSIALRLAGWPDDRPVWTGSCPCQPFSAAGAGKAFADERHLWPAWFPLIAERRPPVVFGEQVEAAIGWGWIDAVFADLEAEGYACGQAVLPACGVGSFHIRQRDWFVAYADGGDAGTERLQRSWEQRQQPKDGEVGGMADAVRERGRSRESGSEDAADARQPSKAGCLANTEHRRHGGQRDGARGVREPIRDSAPIDVADAESRGQRELGNASQPRSGGHADGGFWSRVDWLPCTDGKARPVEPGTFPLAHGIQRRTSKLRAYGNAIVPQVAAAFIRAATP